jgi:hypothetical protein
VAVRGPVSGEVTGRNHCSSHTCIQHPPTDPQLHQSEPRGQGTRAPACYNTMSLLYSRPPEPSHL